MSGWGQFLHRLMLLLERVLHTLHLRQLKEEQEEHNAKIEAIRKDPIATAAAKFGPPRLRPSDADPPGAGGMPAKGGTENTAVGVVGGRDSGSADSGDDPAVLGRDSDLHPGVGEVLPVKLTANFSLSEFATKDGTQVPAELLPNVQRLANNLQNLRDYLKRPVVVTSGYRHLEYNRGVGSTDTSQHVQATAADIRVATIPPEEVAEAIEHLVSIGRMEEGGLGRYDSFTHYDVRGERARWGVA